MINAFIKREAEEEHFYAVPDKEKHGAARLEVCLVVWFGQSILFVWIPSTECVLLFLLVIFHLKLLCHDCHGAARDIEPTYSHGTDVGRQLATTFFQGPRLKVLSLVCKLLKAAFVQPVLGFFNNLILLVIIWSEVSQFIQSGNLTEIECILPQKRLVASESVVRAGEVFWVLVACLLVKSLVVDELGAPLFCVFIPNLISITYLFLSFDFNPLQHFYSSDKLDCLAKGHSKLLIF